MRWIILHKAFLSLLLSFTAVVSSVAQMITVSGAVRFEGDGSAVSFANVVLENREDKKVLGFAVTSDDGRFSITLETEKQALELVVTGFNLERKIIPVSAKSQELLIEVKYQEMSLTEARIKTTPIKSQGDTTSYYVSMFADSLDRSIADVLKKMPGLAVDKSGAIRYQGVLIDNFYIEGVDMMGARYGVATNNIRAKDISTVEVYENHQPIKILQSARGDLEGSGKVAVNLRLKQKSKGAFIGSVHAGAGYGPLMWEGEFVGMLFTEKYQTLTTLKTNNDGRDIVSELKEQYDGLKWMSPVFGVYSPQTPDLDIERFMDNTTHAASLNTLFKIGEDRLLSLNGAYVHDAQSFADASILKYYLPASDPLDIKERTRKNQKTDNAEVRLKYTGNTDKYYCTEVLSAGIAWDRSDGAVETPDALIQQDFSKLASKSISNHFDFHAITDGKMQFGIGADVSFNDLPATLTVTPAIFPELFGYEQLTGASAVQSFAAQAFNAGLRPSLMWSISPRWILSIHTDAVFHSQRMSSALGRADVQIPDNDFRNDNDYLRWDLKPGFFLMYRRNSLQLQFSLDVDHANLAMKDNVRNQKCTESDWFFHPTFILVCSLTPKLKMDLLSSYDEDFAAFDNHYSGYIMNDYRRLGSRGGTLAKNKSHTHNLSLKYSNPLSGVYASGLVQYWGKRSNIMYGTEFIGNLSEVRSYPIDNYAHGFSAEGKVSKYFDTIESTFNLNAGYSHYWMSIMRQGVLVEIETQSPSVGFSCISNIGRRVKTRYELTYSHFKTRYDGAQGAAPINALHHRLSADYQVLPALVLSLSGEHFYNSAVSSSIRHIPFLDGSIMFRAKGCDIILEARNLLNTKDYTYSYNSEGTEFESAYHLRPRALILKVRFNIN